MPDDSVYADLLPSLSPLTAAGIDPDEARLDPKAAMAKLGLGPQTQQQPWYMAQNQAAPQLTPNGNTLPPGLNTRTPAPQTDTQSAAVPGSVTPSGSPSLGKQTFAPAPNQPAASAVGSLDELQRRNVATIGLGQKAYAQSLQATDAMAGQPTEEEATAPYRQAQANYAVPTNPNAVDPTTGKALYKPTRAQMLARAGGAVLKGGVLAALDPAAVGAKAYGAPNADYDYAEDARKAREALAGTQVSQAQANWMATQKRNQELAAARAKNVENLPSVTHPAIAQQEIPIKQQEADTRTQEAQNNSPAAKEALTQEQWDQRDKHAKELGLTGQNLILYKANGKVPDPRQATPEEIARGQALAAWKRDNPGKQPGLDDMRSINAAVSGSEIKGQGGAANGKPIPPALKNKILDEKSAAMNAATSQLRNGMDRAGTPYSKDNWLADMQSAQDKFEAAIEAEGGTADHMAINPDGSWTAAAASSTSANVARSASYTPPAVPKEQLREGRTGTDPRTGQRVIVKNGRVVPLKGGS